MDENLDFALYQQHVDGVGHALQYLAQRNALKVIADVYFHNEFAIAHGYVIVDHGIAKGLGHPYAHFLFGVHDAIDSKLAQDQMLGVRSRLYPNGWYAQGFQVDDAKQAGLDSFADGHQNHIVVVQAELFQRGAVGDIGNDRMGQLVGVLVDDFAVGVDAQDRVTHFHEF